MSGLVKSFDALGGRPEIVMTDPEGALRDNKRVKDEFASMGVQHSITASSAHFVERFNRTFRGMLQKRLEHRDYKLKNRRLTGKTPETPQWHTFIPDILRMYNNRNVHSAIGMTPSEARMQANHAPAKASMELKAKWGRKYPDISVGDTVRVVRKKTLGDTEYTGDFREGSHEVVAVSENFGQKFYRLDDKAKREYIRADIALNRKKKVEE